MRLPVPRVGDEHVSGSGDASLYPRGMPTPDMEPAAIDAPSPWRGRFLALGGIVLVALTLRLPVAAVSPILGSVRQDVALSDTMAGLLGSIPVFAFALFGAITPAIARRLGLEWSLVLALTVSAAGEIARALVSNAPGFLVWTGVALAGMGMGNVLLPPLTKRYFPDRAGLVTAVYSVTISIGAALPPLVVVSVAREFGWRSALGGWAVVALVAALPWTVLAARSMRSAARSPGLAAGHGTDAPPTGRVWRTPLAWGLALMFGLNSLNFYTMMAWLPSILADAGLPDAEAASDLGVYAFIGVLLALVVPPLAVRLSNPLPVVIVSTAAMIAGYVGLVAAPAAAPLLWCVLAGIGPATFPLVLVLIALRTATPEGAVALSGFVQGLGYLVAGTGPLIVGILHGSDGGWVPTFVFLGLTVVAMVAVSPLGCRPGMLEDGWGPAAHAEKDAGRR